MQTGVTNLDEKGNTLYTKVRKAIHYALGCEGHYTTHGGEKGHTLHTRVRRAIK